LDWARSNPCFAPSPRAAKQGSLFFESRNPPPCGIAVKPGLVSSKNGGVE
jgi:hypothetical protein